ncbi:hypothetical protein H6G00_05070 [Leptolyngbya sp. FACHB-541]|uniref:hypothetical protein n=1 Tax=Leptolyngbya sp. FACHB-541 TaxID=2692810 RepID=UPI001687A4E8|nr:hypothetical protein [Leptolyngbya sp. FACHB-541]MBD1995987.1 hypothetical protein [Leptolyngbya sp. FACHB-541]
MPAGLDGDGQPCKSKVDVEAEQVAIALQIAEKLGLSNLKEATNLTLKLGGGLLLKLLEDFDEMALLVLLKQVKSGSVGDVQQQLISTIKAVEPLPEVASKVRSHRDTLKGSPQLVPIPEIESPENVQPTLPKKESKADKFSRL